MVQECSRIVPLVDRKPSGSKTSGPNWTGTHTAQQWGLWLTDGLTDPMVGPWKRRKIKKWLENGVSVFQGHRRDHHLFYGLIPLTLYGAAWDSGGLRLRVGTRRTPTSTAALDRLLFFHFLLSFSSPSVPGHRRRPLGLRRGKEKGK